RVLRPEPAFEVVVDPGPDGAQPEQNGRGPPGAEPPPEPARNHVPVGVRSAHAGPRNEVLQGSLYGPGQEARRSDWSAAWGRTRRPAAAQPSAAAFSRSISAWTRTRYSSSPADRRSGGTATGSPRTHLARLNGRGTANRSQLFVRHGRW